MVDNNNNEDSLEGSEPEQVEQQPPVAETENMAPAPVVQEPVSSPVASNETVQPLPVEKPKSGKPKWFLPAVFAGLLVLGGGAAAYLTVFQNTPERAWKSALSNTADGLDKYLTTATNADQKGFKLDGNYKVSSPIALDGSIKGQWYESDGEMTFDIGAAGARVNAELRTIAPEGSTTPDIYIKVDGLEGLRQC